MADPAFAPTARDRSIATQLHDELKRLIADFKNLSANIENISVHMLALDSLSKEAERANYPILHDTGQIVQNIISQPLSIPELTKNISLLKAAEIYQKDPASLQHVLETFQQYSEATKILVQELELLARDLIF
jgi:hypothetical protein